MNMLVQLNNFQKILVSKVVSTVRSHTCRNLESIQANCFHKLWPNTCPNAWPLRQPSLKETHMALWAIFSQRQLEDWAFEKDDGKLTNIRKKYMIFIVSQQCSIILETACRPYSMIWVKGKEFFFNNCVQSFKSMFRWSFISSLTLIHCVMLFCFIIFNNFRKASLFFAHAGGSQLLTKLKLSTRK